MRNLLLGLGLVILACVLLLVRIDLFHGTNTFASGFFGVLALVSLVVGSFFVYSFWSPQED